MSSLTGRDGDLCWMVWLKGGRPYEGNAGLLSGQSSETRTPVRISEAAADAMSEGASRFSVPRLSRAPNRPQALPGGPLGSIRSSSKGGAGRGLDGEAMASCGAVMESW